MKRAGVVGGILAVLTLYPPLWALAKMGPPAIFSHFAADSFYYLTIARNSLDGPFPSFDGTNLTNGFHPLWQFLLAGVFHLVGREQAAQLTAAFLLSAGFVAAGVVLFGLAALRATRSALAPLGLVPGFFSVAFTVQTIQTKDLGLTYTSSVWAFMNGMESPLTIFCGGLIALLLCEDAIAAAGSTMASSHDGERLRREDRRDLFLGFVLAAATLARLDDGLLVAAFLVTTAAGPGTARRKLARSARLAGPTAIALAGYFAFTFAAMGMWFPVSAERKMGLQLAENLRALFADLAPPLGDLARLTRWNYDAQRSILFFAPAVLAGTLLWARRKHEWPSSLAPFTPLLVYVVLKCVFVGATVELVHQGYWYMSLIVMVVNFALVLVAYDLVSRAGRPAALWATAAWAATYLFTSANALHRVSWSTWWSTVWVHRDEIREGLLTQVPHPKLLELYDGLFAYSLGLPTVTSTALVVDRAGRDASAKGRYLEDCISRGYDITVTCPQAYSLPVRWLPKVSQAESRVIYEHPETNVQFVEVRLRDGTQTPPGESSEAALPESKPRLSR